MLYSYYSVPYGSLNLTETSPAQTFTEPLSLGEVKDFLKLPAEVTDQDEQISGFISSARSLAELMQGRDLVIKQWDLSLDYWPCLEPITLRDPLISLDLLRYRDSSGAYTTLVEDTDYVVDKAKHPGVIIPAYNRLWPNFTPWPSSAILARFTSGVSDTHPFWSGQHGPRIKTGMKMLINGWYTGRLPYSPNVYEVKEIPFGASVLLGYGSLIRVR